MLGSSWPPNSKPRVKHLVGYASKTKHMENSNCETSASAGFTTESLQRKISQAEEPTQRMCNDSYQMVQNAK